ncbi:hypothetical protein ACIGKR_07045 [Rhodococcus qingshengii]|uniref:hypothetical protein n=1 Tax=Rhodococcus qingshengii TaxID=334542 RepID=UPI0037C7914D
MTKVITNHNHNHALTMQYWQVLRHFRVSSQVDDVQLVCFVPLEVVQFLPSGSTRTLPTGSYSRDQLLYRYGQVLRHHDVIASRVWWRSELSHGLHMLRAFAGDPTMTVQSSSGAAQDIVNISLSGTFLPFEDVWVTAVSTSGARVGPVLMTGSSPAVAAGATTKAGLLDTLRNRRSSPSSLETRNAALSLPSHVSRSNLARFEFRRAFPSRVPAPLNITQVGGYLNLVADDPVLSAQVLASALGVAGPNPTPGFDPTLPPLYFVTRTNDRPAGAAQTSTPVQLRVRSDFAAPFDAAVAVLHGLGATLPVLAADAPLTPLRATGSTPPVDVLAVLGRWLTLVPGAGLLDPTVDPLAVGQLAGTGPQLSLARQVDAAAPQAGTVIAAAYALWTCDATTCTQSTVTAAFVDLDPVLAAAGWHRSAPLSAPVSLGDAKDWNVWTNVTGLIAGTSTVGSELRLLFSAGQIAASSVREVQDLVWDGTEFVAPA